MATSRVYIVSILDLVSLHFCSGPQQTRYFAWVIALGEISPIRPVAFNARTLPGAELNYDTHYKEFLAIFEAFKTWRHYLESPHYTIDVITDHKNLEYFSITETLYRRQAQWSEYLFVFNMVVRFRPGKLGEKPDSLTRRMDYYLKKGDRGYALANPQIRALSSPSRGSRPRFEQRTSWKPLDAAALALGVRLRTSPG